MEQSRQPDLDLCRATTPAEMLSADRNGFPIVVLQDRYGGCYSGGAWLAIRMADRLENGTYRIIRCLEAGPSGDDVEAQLFWDEPPDWIAVGGTPDLATAALLERSDASDSALTHELDRKIADGLKSLDEGRSFSAEEVMAHIAARFTRTADAAG